jgi:tRNA (guanine37-N1)-methyltransferase
MKHITVFTLFPNLFVSFREESILGRAQRNGLVQLDVQDLRSHGKGVHRAVDDAPFGGGAGMVLAPEPVFACVEAAFDAGAPRPLFALTPSGQRFDQRAAQQLAAADGGFSLLCGRYEGFDERIHDHLVDGEFSLGDFVLSGGEVAAMAIVEAVTRLLPGVMGNDTSADEESFGVDGLLEYPHYTRPAEFRGWVIPDVLRSGDHARVARWRRAQALRRTALRRPDLFAVMEASGAITPADRKALAEFGLTADPSEIDADRSAREHDRAVSRTTRASD